MLLANFSGVLNSQTLVCEDKLCPSPTRVSLEVLKYLNKVNPNHNVNIYKIEQNFMAIINKVNSIYKFALSNLTKQIMSNSNFTSYYKQLALQKRIQNVSDNISKMRQFIALVEEMAFNKEYFKDEYDNANNLPKECKSEILK